MRRRPVFYGWYDPAQCVLRVSRYPADAPVRPSIAVETKAEVDAMLERKRAEIIWWPPLPGHVLKARAAS